MMKAKIFVLIVCIVILTGCNKSELDDTDSLDKNTIPAANKNSKDMKDKEEEKEITLVDKDKVFKKDKAISSIILNSEESLKEYLIGEWISDKKNFSDYIFTESDMDCKMIVDENLKVDLSFYNRQTNESKGSYKGLINLERLYAKANEIPDLISIDLGESDWPGGEFFFKHRTIYDDKIVMSLFFSGNGNCIFDLLADVDNFEYAPEEIIFEKGTDEKLKLNPIKDSEFYAVFWGDGEDEQNIWLDQVRWTPTEEYDPDALYPTRMTLYEDDMPGSVLYKITKENFSYISHSNRFPGEVYYVKTDKNGDIIELEDAQYKEYIEIINEP